MNEQAKAELKAFKALLDGKGQGDLGEASDLLPFFDANEHLCALIGMYNPNIVDYKNISIAREFSVFGDHRADLVIGDMKNKQFCFIRQVVRRPFDPAEDFRCLSKGRDRIGVIWNLKSGISNLVSGSSSLDSWLRSLEPGFWNSECEIMNLLDRLRAILSRALPAGADRAAFEKAVRPATDPKFGDYQANGCMALAKALGAEPRDLAAGDRAPRRPGPDRRPARGGRARVPQPALERRLGRLDACERC